METSLYAPVKQFLEGLGFTAKGEVGGCDVVALRGNEPPLVVIAEMKLSFNLELILQAVDRAAVCDEVWLAAPISARGNGRESDARFRNLCRRLGFGMLGVSQAGDVQILVSPASATPRRDPRRRSRLVEEHRRRQGDPAVGGGSRAPIMNGVSATGTCLCRTFGGRTATPPRSPRGRARRRNNSASQRLWLVHPNRSRGLRTDQGGTPGAGVLAAQTDIRGSRPTGWARCTDHGRLRIDQRHRRFQVVSGGRPVRSGLA